MAEKLRILYAASEALPLIKTGGLADVAGALPTALRRLGADARLLLPAYPGVVDKLNAHPVGPALTVLPGVPPVQLMLGTLPGADTPVYALSCPALYDRPGSPYGDEQGTDWSDNAQRFGVLSRVAALFGTGASPAEWSAQIVHCNDWQTGLAPAYLAYASDVVARSVFSVHNLAFQGNFPATLLKALALPPTSYAVDGLEFHGQVSFLKAGLYYAAHLSTVSPTYAAEIQTSAFGYGMEGLLGARRDRLTGILNGIDTAYWDPASDPHLPAPYSATRLAAKAQSKRALQERLALEPSEQSTVLGMVSRLTWQKGVDLVLEAAPALLDEPVQLAVLGSGSREYEARWRTLASEYPGRVGVAMGYDEGLAHLIEAGADAFLMPSRFEPCGLNQMYSMRYATPPIVRRTGGLADSVVDTTPSTLAQERATGFVFDSASAGDFKSAVVRALLLRDQKKAWRRIQQAGMARDFSWEASARRYMEVYEGVLGLA